jgi:putative SOS response-associated peptidase YedK
MTERVVSHTFLTTSANDTIASLHHRKPVIVDAAGVDLWPDPSVTDPAAVLARGMASRPQARTRGFAPGDDGP